MTEANVAGFLRKRSGLLALIILFLALSALSGFISNSGPNPWYQSLEKSPFNPPSWAFAVVWPVLYALMATAFWCILRAPESSGRRFAIAVFFIQLVVNFLWSYVFFTMQALLPALVHILVLWILIAATVWAFFKVRPMAGLFLVPYLLWVSFAIHLAYEVWHRN